MLPVDNANVRRQSYIWHMLLPFVFGTVQMARATRRG